MLKLTVKRLDLIAAIEAKAKANQAAYDSAAKSENPLVAATDAAIEEAFKTVPYGAVNAQGYSKASATSAFANLLTYIGMKRATVSKPQLYAHQLAVLNLAQDDVLDINDESNYFQFLQG